MEDNKLNNELETKEESVEESTVEEVEEENESKDSLEETSSEEIKSEQPVEEKAPYDGPSVTVSTRYDYKTLKYYNVMSMVYKRHYPILYLVLALFCIGYDVFFAFKSIIPAINDGTFTASALLLPGIFVLFAAYSVYLFFNFEKSIDKNLTMHFNQSPDVTSVQAEITLEGVTITSSKNVDNPFKYEWIYITQIIEIPQYYYLFAGRQPIIISKDVNNIVNGDEETFKSIMEEQISKKPYKKIDKEILKTPVTYVHQSDLNTDIVEDAVVKDVNEEVENEDVVEENNAIESTSAEESTSEENK